MNTPNPMTIVEAVLLLRSGDPERLTNHGSLHYASLGGGSRLHYRKSAPDDAGPTVIDGEVSEGGRLLLE